ncbi:type II secretion system F family protein, partial [Parvibaculum sp.]
MVAVFELAEGMFNLENIVMLLTAVAAFATILTLTGPLLSTDKLSTRMKYVSTEREAMRARARESLAQEKTRLRHTPKGFMKEVVEKFTSGRALENADVRDKLRQAGFRGPGPMYTFVFFRFVMPPILFVLTLLYLVFLNDFGLPPMARFAASCAAAFVGFYLPNVFVQNVIARRQDSIRKAFPDALDLLLICVESGMSIE